MELPIQYIRVNTTNYIIRRYKIENSIKWSVESVKSTVAGFNTCAEALNFLLISHPYCIYCHTHLKNYIPAKYYDFVEGKDIETKMCCPHCESWNDELMLQFRQEPTKDDHRQRVYKNKTYVKDSLLTQLTKAEFINF